MNLYFMLAFSRSKEPNPVLVELFERLRARGYHVEIGVGSELLLEHAQLAREHDLYILKSHTALWLSLAGIVHRQGGRLLNPYLPCLAVYNKIVATYRMRSAGIPTPPSWVVGDLRMLRPIVAERPLIIKPHTGGKGLGIQIVRTPRELEQIAPPEQPMIIQEYVQGDELKVYVIGDEVFGVRKIVSSTGVRRLADGVSDEIRAIALRCGAEFGLNLYGLDVLETAGGPLVIDVNYFPSYKGVPDAASRLGDDIHAYAHARLAAQPAPAPAPVARTV